MIDLHCHTPLAETDLARSDANLVCVAPPAGTEAVAWLDAAERFPARVRPWAVADEDAPDPAVVLDALHRGAVGLALDARSLAAPDGLHRLAPVLGVLAAAGAPLLVRPTARATAQRPAWWAPVVDDVAALHAAWWAWADGGRERFPRLPVCFAALAGLAPLHGERHKASGGRGGAVDPLTFVETSSYGPRAVDAVVRVLGIDVVCFGSGAHGAVPLRLDPAAEHAIHQTNPARLLAHVTQEVLA